MKTAIRGALIAAGLALATTATAQAQNNMQQMVPATNEAIFQAAQAVGMNPQYQTLNNGAQVVVMRTQGGRSILGVPTACKDGRCGAIQLVAPIAKTANPLQVANQLNNFDFLKAQVTQDGTLILSRYIVTNFNTPIGNLAINMGVLGNYTDSAVKALNSGAGNSSSGTPGAGDLTFSTSFSTDDILAIDVEGNGSEHTGFGMFPDVETLADQPKDEETSETTEE